MQAARFHTSLSQLRPANGIKVPNSDRKDRGPRILYCPPYDQKYSRAAIFQYWVNQALSCSISLAGRTCLATASIRFEQTAFAHTQFAPFTGGDSTVECKLPYRFSVQLGDSIANRRQHPAHDVIASFSNADSQNTRIHAFQTVRNSRPGLVAQAHSTQQFFDCRIHERFRQACPIRIEGVCAATPASRPARFWGRHAVQCTPSRRPCLP